MDVYWEYKNKSITNLSELPEGIFGFVYKITYTDNTYYFGMKSITRKVALPALKSGEQRLNSERKGKNVKGKRAYFDVVTKESDWLSYAGSSESTEGLEVSSKEILMVTYSKRELTYREVSCLFHFDVLEDENCHNSNILGRFFAGNIS